MAAEPRAGVDQGAARPVAAHAVRPTWAPAARAGRSPVADAAAWRLSIWSPHRHSPRVKAFVSLLLLQRIDHGWNDQAEDADLWLIDGALPWHQPLGRRLREVRERGFLRGVVLAPEMPSAAVVDGWTFFRTPLQSSRVLQWLAQSTLHRRLGLPHWRAPALPMMLRTWPDVSRYNRLMQDRRGAIELTTCCSRMLRGPVLHEVLLAACPNAGAALQALLIDAQREGNLVLREAPPPGQTPLRPAADEAAGLAWGLVKKLLARLG